MKIKTNDNIVVIAGKDKGKEGKVIRLLTRKEQVVVEGVNIRTKHIKKTQERPGEIVKSEAPIHISNVMLISPITKKATRVGYTKIKGKKVRVCKKSKEVIDK